jgi:membrane fusion protein (multidrug efflux system)
MVDSTDQGPDRPAETPAVPPEKDVVKDPAPSSPVSAHLAAARAPESRRSTWRKWILLVAVLVGLVAGGVALTPAIQTVLNTVSTDDAYVNGHVTLVAPRVVGQVSRVLVDDNYRVKQGELLVQLDREPYQVMVDIKKAAVVNAEADVTAAQAQVRGVLAVARSQRWKLQRAMEQVDDTVALLKARVATLRSREATLDRAKADFVRAEQLLSRGAIPREQFDQRREAERVAEASVKQSLEEVYEARVALGLVPRPESGELTDVPDDLNQTYSGVREVMAGLVQSLAQVGLPLVSSTDTPRKALEEFIHRDKEGNIDRILERIVPEAPAVRQAEASSARSTAWSPAATSTPGTTSPWGRA